MMTEDQYRRLGTRMHRELWARRRLVPCVTGLLMLLGAAVFGSAVYTPHEPGTEVAHVQAEDNAANSH